MIDILCLASWNADLISHVAHPPVRGETLMASQFTIGPGGKGSNAAVACARQGAKVAVIARVGADSFGRMALDLWRREGIDATAVEVVDDEPSGVAQIWVYDDGDNSIAVAPGAGAGLGGRQVQAASAMIQAAKVVISPCEVPLEAISAAFALAHAAGVLTVLNPAPARPLPDALLACCDVLTPNETEVRTLAGLAPDVPIDTAAQALLARGARAVVVTLGAAGCALYRAGQPPQQIEGYPMTVVDTIGAGDTFTGALAAGLARGLPLDKALHWANAAGSLSVNGRGAIAGMPSLAATEQWLGVVDPACLR